MPIGYITYWNRFFGFINSEDKFYFFHRSKLISKSILFNSKVSFEIKIKQSGPHKGKFYAYNVKEIEKPAVDLFRKDNHEPTQQLNHAIEQVKSWRRYFTQNPSEKRRIFGAVGRFRFIIVGGQKEDWEKDHASKWRIDQNSEYKIEIRSSDIFSRALKILVEYPDELWSFTENPQTLKHTDLENYWKSYAYMDKWRRLMN
jgi:hypothetical protein